MSFLYELMHFIIHRKKFWMIPIFFVMAVLGIFIVFAKGSIVAPFIYTLF